MSTVLPPGAADRARRATRAAPGALRWGIAGYGDVVRRRALPAFAGLDLRVAAIWGRRAESATALAATCAARGTTDFDELLEVCDAVYIATPVAAHVPLALAALEAGRHVLVEKPLGGALGYDRERLLALAADPADQAGSARPAGQGRLAGQGRPVGAVAYYRRLAPAMLALRSLMGQAGPFRAAAAFRGAFQPAPGDPMHWRTVTAVSGGGVLADAGSHRLDLLCWLLGPPSAATAVLGDPFPGGAERLARLDLAWPDGSTARLRCSWTDAGPTRDCLACVSADGRRGFTLRRLDTGRLTGWLDDECVRRDDLAPDPNPLVPVLRDFADCVATGRAPACPLADAVLVDDLIRSAGAPPPQAGRAGRDLDGSWIQPQRKEAARP